MNVSRERLKDNYEAMPANELVTLLGSGTLSVAAKEVAIEVLQNLMDRGKFSEAAKDIVNKTIADANARDKLAYDAVEGYSSTYKTARGIASFVALVGWSLVVLGGFVAVIALSSLAKEGSFGFVAFIPGVGTSIAGLLLVMSGQITRAAVDTADNTGRLLLLLSREK